MPVLVIKLSVHNEYGHLIRACVKFYIYIACRRFLPVAKDI